MATVDSIVRGLNKTLKQLEALEGKQRKKASSDRNYAALMEAKAKEAEAEADRANRVKTKIGELFT